jgi:FkbM family methyltransferase
MNTFSEKHLLNAYSYRSKQPLLIDVGAHTGSFSWPYIKKGWRIVAFEPEYKNFKALRRNLLWIKGVKCINKAVADKSGLIVPFYVSKEHYGIHSLKPFHATHKSSYSVETIRLDDALKNLKIQNVTLLKIDIEGADFLALKSFDFKNYRPEIVIVEFMDDRSIKNFGYTHHDMAKFMQSYGFTTFVSEWAPFKEYARKGQNKNPHRWIQCCEFPASHEPAWGNLIFVDRTDAIKFKNCLNNFINKADINQIRRFSWIRRVLSRIPGTRILLNLMLNIKR